MANDSFMKNKVLLIGSGLIFIGLIVGFFLYKAIVFQVLNVTPSQGSTITSLTPTLVFSYNKPIATFDGSKQILNGDGIVAGSKSDGKKLYIQLKALETGKSYTVTVINVQTDDGASIIPSYTYSFRYAYDPQNDGNYDKSNIDDPLVKHLPVTTSQYYISYSLLDKPDDQGHTEKITIALLLTNADLADNQKVRVYKKAAEDFLISKGIVLEDYVVEYSPPGIE